MGPISREGSSTTAAPHQVSMVGMPTEVVLKPPGPPKTRAWVDPLRHGSISSGAVPPWPQVLLVCRIEGAACDAILIDPVGLADDDAAMGRVRAGEQSARVADGEPIGMAEIVGATADQARAGSAAHGLLERQADAHGSSGQPDRERLQSAEIEGAQKIQQRRVAEIRFEVLILRPDGQRPSRRRRRRCRRAA